MESSVRFDLTETMTPCIRLEIAGDGSDMRDTVSRRFTESLCHMSQWCRITYANYPGMDTKQVWHLTPILPDNMRAESAALSQAADAWDEIYLRKQKQPATAMTQVLWRLHTLCSDINEKMVSRTGTKPYPDFPPTPIEVSDQEHAEALLPRLQWILDNI